MPSQGGTTLVVVDPHVHFWDTRQVRYPWLETRAPAFSGDNRLLPDPYGPTQLMQDSAEIELSMSVHVEANPHDPVAETRWLQSLADDPSGRGHPHGIVAYADLSRADAPAVLDALAVFPRMRGIRQILNRHQDPRYRYVEQNHLADPRWQSNLARLVPRGWSFDLQLYPSQMPAAAGVIDSLDAMTFILNHAGMFVDRDSPHGWRRWRQGLRELALRANVAVKISGLAMFDHHWTEESFRPYVLEAIDAFGVDRTMFASNFPIDRLHARYGALWQAYARIVAGLTAIEKEQLFRSNAVRYYALRA
jgi:predicted TIM-barrel fold metal-dependent hydrolase